MYQDRLSVIGAEADAQIAQLDKDYAALETELVAAGVTIRELETELAACQGSNKPKTLYGSCLGQQTGESKAQAYARVNNLFGDIKVLRIFDGGKGPANWGTYGEELAGPDDMVIMSFKASPSAILNGSLDAKLIARWKSVPQDRAGRVTDTLWHEPEDNIESGEYTEVQWEAAQSYMLALQKRTPGTSKVELMTILMSYSLEAAANRDEDLYPVPGMDILGVDVYNERWDLIEAFALKHGYKEIIVAEYGWIRKVRPTDDEMVAYFNRSKPQWDALKVPVTAFAYFNGGVGTQYGVHALDDRPKAAAVWRSYCAL